MDEHLPRLPREALTGQATVVEVTFQPAGDGTRVRLVNSGFDVFGDGAAERAGRVGDAWVGIASEYSEML